MKKEPRVRVPGTKNALIAAASAMALFALVAYIFLRNRATFGAVSIKDLIIFGAQAILLLTLIEVKIPRNAKIKGILGLSIFIVLRLLLAFQIVTIHQINKNLMTFTIFFVSYIVAALFALKGLEEMA